MKIIMAEDDDDVFVYMGGDQEVPRNVRRVRIHKSVKIIPARTFSNRRQLIYVEFHDEIEIIVKYAFVCCSFWRIELLGVKVIGVSAFSRCKFDGCRIW